MTAGKYYNVMVVPDGVERPFGIRIRSWLFKILVVAFLVITIGLIGFFTFYGSIVMRAASAERLERENEILKRYKYKLGLLEENMKETRRIVERISQLAGVDIQLPELPPDSAIFSGFDKRRKAVMQRSSPIVEGRPDGLPLRGFMTRGFSEEPGEHHPGIDIAAAVGTPVLATASGRVSFAGFDSTYGYMLILEHDGGVSTVYGHNTELLVETGGEVLVGGRIALSGNSGKSTAPHLHYEIREHGKPVNPLKYMSNHEISIQ
ncbi:MAG: M23 family metallopeptidase [Candidatus Zixiibacteriota bacterium]|nr:MAG: M23 family metallopeptidase [candidate division Zixibacteria bacterium]